MHSRPMLGEGARPEIVRNNMGHANINLTQIVYGKSWWDERVDAVTHAIEAVTNAVQSAVKEEKKNQPEWVENMPPDLECGGSLAVLNGLWVELRLL